MEEIEDCSLHHDCETAHTIDPANDEYNMRHIEELAGWDDDGF